MQNFNEAGLPQQLFHRLEQMGFITPTPIQVQAIPPALQGKDILGTAQTGTGKTGAFGIPLVTQLMTTPRGTALVLLPTRELATQVLQQLKKFIGNSSIPTALLIGGEAMGKQFSQLKSRPRLIVGTPGRVNDHLQRGTLMLHDTNFLVLDETDRMLDLGFGAQLETIARYLTAKRQTLMFSATLPANIEKLSAKYLQNPVRISVGSTVATAPKVTQAHVKLSDDEKFPRLLQELESRSGSVILFVKTKHGADRMATRLRKSGHEAEALHGDLRQNRRDRVIQDFRKLEYRVLVATDIAARGLDIPHIAHVINYDLPQCAEDYIHRIGRTARAGAEGDSLTLLGSQDGSKWREIQRLLNPDMKPHELDDPYRGERSSPPANNNGNRRLQSRHRRRRGPQSTRRAAA